jgi:hypothetical protein
MRQIFNQRLLLFCCFALAIGVLASCKKNDDNTNNGQVQLFSFGPTGAEHGDTIRFIGQNLNKVTAVQFTGENAVVEQKDFKQQTAELILLIVPTNAEKGNVTLKTPDGDITTKTALNLNVKTAATVASVTPKARPGEDITLTGDYLNWVTRVTFNKNLVVTTFVSKTQNQLVVKVPDEAQTGPLLVSFSGTDTIDVETADTLHVTLPVATSFSPNPVKHNTNLTINGTDLDLARQVLLPGVAKAITSAAFVSQSATQLVVNVDSATVKGKVTLVAASGVNSVSATDLDVVMPSITSFSPDPVAPGADLTINGTNLDVVKSIGFTGVADAVSSFVSKSATKIVVKVPTGAVTGKLTLYILNSGLSVQSAGELSIIGSSVAPIILYDDALTSAWNGWTGGGWGGTKDVASTEQARSGTKSVKINYTSGAYGVPWQLGGANINLGGYKTLKVSLYGGAGSNGKNVNIGFNENDGKTVSLVEGQWTDFEIPLSQISTAATLTHLYIKNYAASGDFTIYVDNLGIY